ncbi:MAG: hypothetical protein ACTSU4_15435 [Promethearchaeota archaeon]
MEKLNALQDNEKMSSNNLLNADPLIRNELPYKYEIYRKLTHLVVLGIIFFYFTLGFLIKNFFILIFSFLPVQVSTLFYLLFDVEDNIMIFTQFLVVFLVGVSTIGLMSADFVRILRPKNYPLKPVNKILREKELHMRIGPQISMAIGCFSIILLYGLIQPIGPLIICLSMTISIFGDMAANLIGKKVGKFHLRKSSNKTYAGLIAEILVGFISGFIFLKIIEFYFNLTLLNMILYPLLGALIIGFIDYLDLDIDDNLLYPFISSTVLFLIAYLF